MALAIEPNLFAPSGDAAFEGALGWVDAVLFGPVALSLCVIAVALVGMLALTGRLPSRQGLRVVLGCFILFGAPVIAAGLLDSASGLTEPQLPPAPVVAQDPPREELPPAHYDLYASASLREN